MAWTTPGTAVAGSVLTSAFWNAQVRDQFTELAPLFAAFTSYTPQIDQGATTNITKTTTYAASVKIGKLVIAWVNVTMTGAGTTNNTVTVTVPYTEKSGGATCGAGRIYDQSTNTSYAAAVEIGSGKANFIGDWSGGGAWGTGPNLALAANDIIEFFVIYESA